MKKLIILLFGVALIFSVAAVAGAVPISGELYFGSFAVDPLFDAATAIETPLMTTSNVYGTNDLGSLTGLSFTTNVFNFDTPSIPASNPLWTAGGFSFILDTVGKVFQVGNQLGLTGLGTLAASGFDDTVYTWDLNITDLSAAFSFSQSQGPAPVPEPATMLLLGTGLIGLAGFARKKIRS